MRLRMRSPALFCGLLLAGTCAAQPASEPQRAEFKRLHAAALQGDAGTDDFAALSGYPLYPYLLAARLTHRLKAEPGAETDGELAEFLQRYSDTAAAAPLRAAWLDSLARRENWAVLLDQLPPGAPDPKLRCLRLRAQLALGLAEGAREEATALWRYAGKRPDDCQPVFEWLRESGALTAELLEERSELARRAGELDLVQAIAAWQSGAARAYSERWLKLMRDPEGGLKRVLDEPQSPFDAPTVLQALQLLARRDAAEAAALQPRLAERGLLTAAEAAQAAAIVGYGYILVRDPAAREWYMRAGTAELEPKLRDWRVRSALFTRDWQAVQSWIELLPAAERAEERWRYWHARALLEQKRKADKADALAALRELAKARSYYGYLAADRLKQPYALNHESGAGPDDEVLARLAGQGAAQRARELWLANFQPEARAEWQLLTAGLKPAGMRQAALLARGWGWHASAIISAQAAGDWDDLELRYPLPYREPVEQFARERGLDPAWVFGLMRSESLFMPDVRSAANAYGLMQLLPGTGERTARKLGLPWRGIAMLTDPRSNIQLGTAYLQEMRAKFGGGIAPATAAYNAGPQAVMRWLPQEPAEGALWVEIIPFNETNKYVKTVLEHATVFEWRLRGGKKPTQVSERLGRIPAVDQLPES